MYIKVRVVAGAKKEILEQVKADHFKIYVKQKAERNMANRRVAELVSEFFTLPLYKVKLVSGHHSSSKIFSLDVEK